MHAICKERISLKITIHKGTANVYKHISF